jgi:ABC-2 type transport system ATP-binding protein
MSEPVIEANGLTKRYGSATVVGGVSFTVDRGEIFGVLGPNGAGKTTTILMLLGLTDISDGTVRLLGHDPAREPFAVKRRVGYLPDSVGFYDHLTAMDNLYYTARLIGIPLAERDARIMSALERVGLGNVINKNVGTFSHGMRQRLGVAEILMKGAEIAILDEPTSGLDPQATAELLEMIRGLKKDGVTIMLSSHLLDQVQRICDRVALFHGGQIRLMGTIGDLGRQVLGGGYAVEVEALGSGLQPHLAKVPGVQTVEEVAPGKWRLSAAGDVRADAAAAVVGAGGKLLRLSVEEPSLYAIYSRYFQNQGEARHAA